MEIKKFIPTGFSLDKKPTSRMLFNELIKMAFIKKGEGDEKTYQKIMDELVPNNPDNVWGDALDMTEGKPPISEEKIGKLYVTFCIHK